MLTYKAKHHVLASLQNKTLQTGRYFCKIAKKTPHNYINIFFQKVCLGWNFSPTINWRKGGVGIKIQPGDVYYALMPTSYCKFFLQKQPLTEKKSEFVRNPSQNVKTIFFFCKNQSLQPARELIIFATGICAGIFQKSFCVTAIECCLFDCQCFKVNMQHSQFTALNSECN